MDSFHRADWLSLAQAVGSVAAIAGAYLFGKWQSDASLRHAQLLEREAEGRKLSSILALCEAARRRANSIAGIFDGGQDINVALYSEYDKSIIDSIVAALAAIPVHELRSAEGAIALLDLRDRLIFLRNCLERYKAGPDTFEVQHKVTNRQRREILESNVKMFVKLINRHYETVGAAIRVARATVHSESPRQ